MSPRARHAAWLLVGLSMMGCQSTGRMTRGPQPALPPAQARNQPPTANPRTPPQGVAANPPAGARPATEFPAAPASPAAKTDDKLVIRATAPSVGEHEFSPSDAHHPAAPPSGGSQADQVSQRADKVRELYERAVAKDAEIRDYTCRFRRREVIQGKQLPEDVLLFRHLKQPNSIYFKWLPGTQNEGRELAWVHGQYGNQIQVRTGKGDLLAGIRTELDPRSERATQNSRRTIDEAGLPMMLQRFGAIFAARQGQPAALQHLGPQQRPESRTPMECVAQQIAPGQEKHMARGGTRFWYFCTDPQAPEQGLPTLVITLDENRREVEHYCFDQFRLNTGLRPQDFDPDNLWGKR